MDIDKLKAMALLRGIELAEDSLNDGAKGLAHLAIDVLEELVKSTENAIDDVAFAAMQGVAREMADKIEISL